MQVRADQDHQESMPRIAFEDVLTADRTRLQHWFTGTTVVIGNTVPGEDQHPTLLGGKIFGCEVQAQTIEALLSGRSLLLYERPTLAVTILLWAVVAAAVVGLMPCSRTASLVVTTCICAAAWVIGTLAVFCVAVALTDFWQVQAGIAAGTLLATGGLAYLAKAVRNRQIHLAPELIWEIEDATIATTLLATASDHDGSTHQESVTGSTRARPATSLALPDQHTTPPGPPVEKHSSARR
jgi:CHASE2 domain-containing sensor protein